MLHPHICHIHDVGRQDGIDFLVMEYLEGETLAQFEVYVTSFPRGGEEIRVSQNGGVQPRWRADGRELFFLDLDRRLMSVDVRDAGGRIEFGVPRLLFQAAVDATPEVELYDVTRDGQRFIMMVPYGSAALQMNAIVNWPSVLAK